MNISMTPGTVVVKYGGHAMSDAALAAAFADDLAGLVVRGMRFVIVHGGGPQITGLLKRLNIESRFVNGLRVTDAATMQAVEMVLCGEVNKAVVSFFSRRRVRAAGISGRDGGLLRAEVENPALGLVGEVRSVDSALLECLLNGEFVPVVAPVASGPDGEPLNINADTAAGAIAGALRAAYFVLVSDVPGVLGTDENPIPVLDRAAVARLKDEGVISGGMIPKVDACLNALSGGCPRALILDGRAPSSLRRCLSGGEALGTAIME
ncbi:MAG: acetylglutamate kinase [Desulfovibrio sp.]|jgi:acetylglutamate kinase|nr:acetylglutamate kinase [Desulfovibrio sp.]